MDGPYGTPTHRIFTSERAALVGAGIGITPFASILQSIMYTWVDRPWPLPASWGTVLRDALPSSLLLSPVSLSPFLSSLSCSSTLSFLGLSSLLPHRVGSVTPPSSLSPALFSEVLKSLLLSSNSNPSAASLNPPEEKAHLPQLPALLDGGHPGQRHEAPQGEPHLPQASLGPAHWDTPWSRLSCAEAEEGQVTSLLLGSSGSYTCPSALSFPDASLVPRPSPFFHPCHRWEML